MNSIGDGLEIISWTLTMTFPRLDFTVVFVWGVDGTGRRGAQAVTFFSTSLLDSASRPLAAILHFSVSSTTFFW